MRPSPRHARSHRTPRGFTLVECICAITVVGVVSAVVLPVINSATTSYVNVARSRDASENVAYALDRCVNLLQDAPLRANNGSISIRSANSTSIRFTDNRGLSLAGRVLSIRDSGGATAALLRDVQTFSIGYFAADGVTSTASAPQNSWICTLQIRHADFELRTSVYLRTRSAQ
jgi:prepilin-type N-terminal cleavage/methylation domain-containing protein